MVPPGERKPHVFAEVEDFHCLDLVSMPNCRPCAAEMLGMLGVAADPAPGPTG